METQQSSNFLNQIVVQSPNPVAVFDNEMNFVLANPAWLSFFDLDESIIGKNQYEVFPYFPEHIKEAHKKALTGETLESEGDSVLHGSDMSWVKWKVCPWKKKCGEIGGVVVLLEDISTQKRLEDEHDDQEVRFKSIFDQAGMGIVRIDLRGNYTIVNRQFSEMLGYSEDELLKMNFVDITHLLDRPADFNAYNCSHDKEFKHADYEKRFIKKDGSILWAFVSVNLFRNKQGDPMHFIATITDITKSKAVETALLESEQKFKVMFDQTAMGMAQVSLEGRIIAANQKMCDILGFSSEELFDLNFQQFTYQEDLPQDMNYLDDLLNGRIQTYSIEKRYIRKDNKLIWAFLTVSLVRNADKRPMYFIAALHDIDARKKTENELKKYQHELEDKVLQRTASLSLLQKISSASMHKNQIHKTIKMAVDGVCEMTNWQIGHFHPTEKLRTSLLHLKDIWSLKDDEKYGPFVLITENLKTFDKSLVHKIVTSRRPYWSNDIFLDSSLIRSPIGLTTGLKSGMAFPVFVGGEVAGVLEFFVERNIHPSPSLMKFVEQVATQISHMLEHELDRETITLSECRLQAIIDNIPARIYLKDTEGRYLIVNRIFEEFFGFKREEVLGKTAYNFFDTAKADGWSKNDKDVLSKGKIVVYEINFTHKGQSRDYLLTKFPVRDDKGKIYALGGISFDITDEKLNRKRVHQLLNREHMAREEAEKAIQARDEFISVASHELKAPISSIKLKIELMNRQFTRTPDIMTHDKIQQSLAKLDKDADRLNTLVNRLLDVTRIQAGKLELNHERCYLNEIVRNLVDGQCLSGDGQNYSIKIDMKEDIFGVWDRSRLEQVILNLLTNAIKFGEHKPIHIETQSLPGKVRLTVKDHGLGIPPEHLERIFERFERASAKEGIQGLGLGLYIVKQIVEAHGGTIRVESKLNEGSTFIVDLPLENSDHLHSLH